MSNSPSSILSRLRSKGHITQEEYSKLKEAITLGADSREPTQFIGIGGSYDFDVYCQKCGYKVTRFAIQDTNYCPVCGRTIFKKSDMT